MPEYSQITGHILPPKDATVADRIREIDRDAMRVLAEQLAAVEGRTLDLSDSEDSARISPSLMGAVELLFFEEHDFDDVAGLFWEGGAKRQAAAARMAEKLRRRIGELGEVQDVIERGNVVIAWLDLLGLGVDVRTKGVPRFHSAPCDTSVLTSSTRHGAVSQEARDAEANRAAAKEARTLRWIRARSKLAAKRLGRGEIDLAREALQNALPEMPHRGNHELKLELLQQLAEIEEARGDESARSAVSHAVLGVILEQQDAQQSKGAPGFDSASKNVLRTRGGNEEEARIARDPDAVGTNVDAGGAFAGAVADARARMVDRATDVEIAEVSGLLMTAKTGLERSQREEFVVAIREMLDSKLLDIFEAGSGKKLTLTLKNGQVYLQGGGTSRTLSEADFMVRPRELPSFSKRPSRASAETAKHSPE